MSLLVATELAKAYGALDVFQGVSARLEAGDRVGLVGLNGTGRPPSCASWPALRRPPPARSRGAVA